MIQCTCPSCQATLELPDHLGNTAFGCPGCGKSFVVPAANSENALRQSFMERLLHTPDGAQPGAVPMPPPGAKIGTPPPPAQSSSSHPAPEPPPLARRPLAAPPEPPAAWMDDEPIRERPYYREDDYPDDDFDDPRPRGGYSRDQAVRSAAWGMSLSMVGLIGILIGIFVFVFSSRRGPGGLNALEAVTLILAIGALLSFAFTLMGIVFSSRGMDRSNDHNRGMAVAGLVCGILGLVLSVVFGSFYFFCGVMVRMIPF